jgi:deazaflavin-dependent oxidoreductase (nitroreductase family)
MELMRTDLVKNALASSAVTSVLKKTVPPLDKALLRLSRGWINTGMQTVVLLQTTGARSGQLRTIATLCMPVGRDLILVGSNWGQGRDPAWVHNLRANPDCHTTFRGYVGEMTARELESSERATIWKHLVRYNPQYQTYQEGTRRRLPVMLLSRPD